MAKSGGETYEFDITGSTRRIVIDVERDAAPDYATIVGRFSSPVDRSIRLFAQEPGEGRDRVRRQIRLDRSESEFALRVDRTYVSADSIEILNGSTVIGRVSLLPDSQEVTLTVPPDQSDD